jgi:zinc transporter 2
VTGILLVEACQRLRHPQNVRGSTMFAIALTGVLVNLALAAVLSGAGGHGQSHGGLSSGGCGHSHATESVVSSSTPWTPVASELRQARLSHGHSHVGGVCGSVQTPLLASAEEGRSESAPASFPPGAVFFTRGRGLTLPVTPPEAEPEAPPPQEAPPCDAPPPESDLNTRGAYVHVLGDLLQSLGVLVAACIIWAHLRLHVLDPILTLLFSALVLATTTRLLRDVVDIVMARAPRGLETQAVAQGLRQQTDGFRHERREQPGALAAADDDHAHRIVAGGDVAGPCPVEHGLADGVAGGLACHAFGQGRGPGAAGDLVDAGGEELVDAA